MNVTAERAVRKAYGVPIWCWSATVTAGPDWEKFVRKSRQDRRLPSTECTTYQKQSLLILFEVINEKVLHWAKRDLR